jgi:hypothetical protein
MPTDAHRTNHPTGGASQVSAPQARSLPRPSAGPARISTPPDARAHTLAPPSTSDAYMPHTSLRIVSDPNAARGPNLVLEP